MAEKSEETTLSRAELLQIATQIVAEYVGNNTIPPGELGPIISEVHNTLAALAERGTANGTGQRPAVPVNKSITPDFLICLEDGKHLKMLKRYLRTHFDMSPEDYRAKWGLPHDYPMVAPKYAAKRSDFAKKIGLGKSKRSRPARRKRAK